MSWLRAQLRTEHHPDDEDAAAHRMPVLAKKSPAVDMTRTSRSRLEEYGRVIKKRAQEEQPGPAAADSQPRAKYANRANLPGSFRIMRRGEEIFGRSFLN